MRSYLRISPQLVAEKEKDGYQPAAIAAYVALLCEGAGQNPAGRFKNLTVLRAHLGQHGRWARFMVNQQDLEIQPDGTCYIVGWDEWQEGDWRAAERMRRVREGKKKAKASDAQNRNASDDLESNGSDGANRNEVDTTVTSLSSSSVLLSSSPLLAPPAPERRDQAVIDWFKSYGMTQIWVLAKAVTVRNIASCALPDVQLFQVLKQRGDEFPADHRAGTPDLFWPAVQIAESEWLKQQGRSSSHVNGFTKAFEPNPERDPDEIPVGAEAER